MGLQAPRGRAGGAGRQRLRNGEEKLKEMQKSTRLNSHEVALMHQTWGYLYSEKEDYPAAIREFEAAIATGGLPLAVEISVLFNTGQLYIVTEEYRKGIAVLEEWFRRTEQPTASASFCWPTPGYDGRFQDGPAARGEGRGDVRQQPQGELGALAARAALPAEHTRRPQGSSKRW